MGTKRSQRLTRATSDLKKSDDEDMCLFMETHTGCDNPDEEPSGELVADRGDDVAAGPDADGGEGDDAASPDTEDSSSGLRTSSSSSLSSSSDND